MFKVLDLFSGVGGMAEGFLQAGFSIPYASDISKQASMTYINRHKQLGYDVKYYCGDIAELSDFRTIFNFLDTDFSQIDVICGGPPCQGFSLAGQRKSDDLRNILVQNYIKILNHIKPKYFVMENVVGIQSTKFDHYKGLYEEYNDKNAIEVLRSEFEKVGYSRVEIKVLDASHFGVPQKRQRIIFLGTRDDMKYKLVHPTPTHNVPISAKEAISDLENISNGSIVTKYNKSSKSKYQQESKNGRTPNANGQAIKSLSLTNHQTSVHTKHTIERFTLLNQGETIGKLLNRLDDFNKTKFNTKKRNCKKMIESEPSPTVLTLPDDIIHYNQNRILTVRETARLQSFDDSFEFLGKRTTGGNLRKKETPQYTLVGNAIPPLLAYAIAKQVIEVLLLQEGYKNGKITLQD